MTLQVFNCCATPVHVLVCIFHKNFIFILMRQQTLCTVYSRDVWKFGVYGRPSLASQGEGLVSQSGPAAVHSTGLLDREVRGPPDISVVEPCCILYLYYATDQYCSSEKDPESGHFTWVMGY